jgi:hypothetical protein
VQGADADVEFDRAGDSVGFHGLCCVVFRHWRNVVVASPGRAAD